MSFFINWGQEWIKSQKDKAIDEQNFNAAKNSLSDADVDALGGAALSFQSMTPDEQSDLPIAAASLGLTGSQYYNLWTQTNTVVPNRNDDDVKKRSISFLGKDKRCKSLWKTSISRYTSRIIW